MSRRASQPAHYFTARPAVASCRQTVDLVLPDLRLTLVTDRGVFSPDRVDAGTKALLLDGPPLPAGPADVVDLGCGYGPIAVTLALRAPATTVWAVDVNERAVALCVENAERAGVADRVRAVGPDAVLTGLAFAQLWSNPPIRIGKAALHELLSSWLSRLGGGGRAALVVHKHLGADSLQRWLAGQGWAVSRRASKGGYRLLDVEARP